MSDVSRMGWWLKWLFSVLSSGVYRNCVNVYSVSRIL